MSEIKNSSEAKEVAELTFEKLEQYFDAAKNVIEQYGGDVAELGLLTLRVEAASHLVPAIILLIVFGIVAKKTIKKGLMVSAKATKDALFVACKKPYVRRGMFEDELVRKYFGISCGIGEKTMDEINAIDITPEYGLINYIYIGAGVISGIIALTNAISLLNVWAWAGIFYPELYAVHKFILN